MRDYRSPRGGSRNPYGNINWRGGGNISRFPSPNPVDWRKWLPYIAGGIAVLFLIWVIATENLFIVIAGTLLMAGVGLGLGAAATGVFMVIFPLIAEALRVRIRN